MELLQEIVVLTKPMSVEQACDLLSAAMVYHILRLPKDEQNAKIDFIKQRLEYGVKEIQKEEQKVK